MLKFCAIIIFPYFTSRPSTVYLRNLKISAQEPSGPPRNSTRVSQFTGTDTEDSDVRGGPAHCSQSQNTIKIKLSYFDKKQQLKPSYLYSNKNGVLASLF